MYVCVGLMYVCINGDEITNRSCISVVASLGVMGDGCISEIAGCISLKQIILASLWLHLFKTNNTE